MGALPQFVCDLDIPTRAEDLAVRYHNKYAKEALRDAVEKWQGHDKGFPTRFKREAKTRFHHFERTEKYKAQKQKRYRSSLDLVKSGDTRYEMLHRFKIELGGTAEKGTIHVTLTMRFAFRGGSGRFRKQGTTQEVTVQKMMLELQDCDQQDAELIAKWTLEGYMKRVNEHRSARKRVRLPKR